MEKYLELNWREVTCKRSVAGDAFPLGIQDFDFSVGGSTNAWIPAYSYFRVEATLEVSNGAGGWRQPYLQDKLALAYCAPHALYSNCYFRCGGQDVSSMTSFIGQSGAIKERIGKSGAWIQNVGRDCSYSDPDFTRRCHSISADGWFHKDGLIDLSNPNPLENISQNNIANIGVRVPIIANDGNSTAASFALYDSCTIRTSANQASNIPTAAGNPYFYDFQSKSNDAANNGGNLGLTGVVVGDYIILSDQAAATITDSQAGLAQITGILQVVSVTGFTSAILALVSPNNGVSVAFVNSRSYIVVRGPVAQVNSLARTVADPRNGKNKVFLTFQPSLGIFDLHQGIGSGDFKFQFTPNVNYQTSCIESAGRLVRSGAAVNNLGTVAVVGSTPTSVNTAGTAGQYRFVINNVLLYIATIKQSMPMSGVLPLSLMETQIMQKTMSSTNANITNQLDFTVPPSTLAITIWVQGPNVGNTTLIPPTKFKVAQGTNTADENLQSIQITYGNTTKPSTLFQSSYNKQEGTPVASSVITSLMQQRWIMSQQNAGKFGNEGGTESYRDYLNSGAYYHFDFSRDKQDSSSYVNVLAQFNQDLPAGTNLYICAWYSRQVEVSFESGVVTSVVSVNR